MHAASPTDFPVEVPGVGNFMFARRMMADHLKINVEYSRLTEGVEPTPWLDTIATCIAVIKTLAVRVPDDWDIDAMDPLEEETYNKLLKVHGALRAKEDSFRKKPQAPVQGGGQAPSV
jgi:hypothetical protein